MSGKFFRNVLQGVALGVATFYSGGGTLFAFIAAGASIASRTLRDRQLAARQEGVFLNVRKTQAPVRMVYGTQKVGVQIVDYRIDRSSTKQRDLYIQAAVCLGSENGEGIDGITEIYLDEDLAVVNPTPGDLSAGVVSSWQGHIRYIMHEGSDAQDADSDLVDLFPGVYAASDRGRRIAYLTFLMTFNPDRFPSSVPNITAVVRGRRVYDPRDPLGGPNGDGYVFSDNPVLCALDYLTSDMAGARRLYPERDGGAGRSEIDEPAWISAANTCDELVTIPGGSQKRFTCNGWIDTSADPKDVLEEIMASCRGSIVWQSGKFRPHIRVAAAPTVFQLTEDNIVGSMEVVRAGTRNVFNRVVANYIDGTGGTHQALEVQWPEPGDTNTFLTNDGDEENVLHLDLPFTNDRYMAQQIALVAVKESRADMRVTLSANESALQLQVGDVVRVSHDTPGWDSQEFWVLAAELSMEGTVNLALAEYDLSAYVLDPQQQPDAPPGSDLPDPNNVPPPENVAAIANSSTAQATQGGQYVPRILLTWDEPEYAFIDGYSIEYQLKAAEGFTAAPRASRTDTQAYISPVSEGFTYVVRIRTRSTLGVESAPVDVEVAVSSRTADIGRLALNDYRIVDRTDGQITVGWTRGALVHHVWEYWKQLPIPLNGTNPWPTDALADVRRVLSVGDDTAVWDEPPPRQAIFIEHHPRAADGATGPVERMIITPEEGQDAIVFFSVGGQQADGSVVIRVGASSRAQSIRYEIAVGGSPARPDDVAVEAGTIHPIASFAEITLPAGTVGPGERIIVSAAAYLNSNGTGATGVADHGETVSGEWERVNVTVPHFVPTRNEESGGQGIYDVRLEDPDNTVNLVETSKKVGSDDPGSFVIKSASPTHLDSFSETVALVEGHPGSTIRYRGTATLGDQVYVFEAVSDPFDAGRVPNVVIHPVILEETQQASASLYGDADTTGHKVLASLSPASIHIGNVSAQTTRPGRSLHHTQVGALLAGLTPGATVYFGAVGVGPNGELGTEIARASAVYGVVQPVLEFGSLVGNVFTVRVNDPSAQADTLHTQIKVGDAPWGSKVLRSANPTHNSQWAESVTLVEGHPSQIRFILTSTLSGTPVEVEIESGPIDIGKIPNTYLQLTLDADGNVQAIVAGDSDQLSGKVDVRVGVEPTDAQARAAIAREGRVIVTPTLVTLDPGETAYGKAFGYSLSAAGGLESTAAATDRVTRPVSDAAQDPIVEILRAVPLNSTNTLWDVSVTMRDPELRLASVQFSKVEESGPNVGFESGWDVQNGTPGISTILTRSETILVNPGTESRFVLRYNYTNGDGQSITVDTSPIIMPALLDFDVDIPLGHTDFQPQWQAGASPVSNYFMDHRWTRPATYNFNLLLIGGKHVPERSLITAFQARLYRGTTFDSASISLWKGIGESAVQLLGTLTHTSTGWTTLTLPLNETVLPDQTYRAVVNLRSDNSTAKTNCAGDTPPGACFEAFLDDSRFARAGFSVVNPDAAAD